MVDKNRRKFLGGLAAAGTASIAGCGGLFGGSEGSQTPEDSVRVAERFDNSDLNELQQMVSDYDDSFEDHQTAYDDVLADFDSDFTTEISELTGNEDWEPGFQISDEVVLGYQQNPLETNQNIVRDENDYVRPDGLAPPFRDSGTPTFNGIKDRLDLPDNIYEELELNDPEEGIRSSINTKIENVGSTVPYVDGDLNAAIRDLEFDKARLDKITTEYQEIINGGSFDANGRIHELEGLENIINGLNKELQSINYVQIDRSELQSNQVQAEEIRSTGVREVYDDARDLYIDAVESLAEAEVLKSGYESWISQLEEVRSEQGRFYDVDDDMDSEPTETTTEEPTETTTEEPTETTEYEVRRRQVFEEDTIYSVVKDQNDGKLDDYDRDDLLEDFVDRLENRTGWNIRNYDDLFDGDSTNPTETTRIDLKWEQTRDSDVRNTGIKFWYNFEEEEDRFTTESIPEGDNYIDLDDDFGQELADYVSDNSLGRSF